MSHEIGQDDVFGEVQVHGERAWHGLGVAIPDGLKTWPAFQQIGLGWETELLPLQAIAAGNTIVSITSHKAHRRIDTGMLLSVVGADYKPIQNKELAEFTDSLVEADRQVTVETAGSLRNGKIVYALVRLPHDIAVTGDDILQQYVLIRNSHDGSSAFYVHPTSVRVVCANTLRMSERDASRGIRFQHTGEISSKVEHARLTLGLITDDTKRFEAQVRLLAAKPVSKNEVRDYFRTVYDATFGVVPVQVKEDSDDKTRRRFERQLEKRDGLIKTWTENMDRTEQTLNGISGTAWAAYNAVSYWHDHQRGRFLGVADSPGRVHSNLFGTSHSQKTTAFKKALTLV